MKRDLSPTEQSPFDDGSSKKPKRVEKLDPNIIRTDVSVAEKKLSDITEKLPKIDEAFMVTSPGPQPGSVDVEGKVPPPWVQGLYSVLKGIRDDISNLRSDLHALQNRLPLNSNTDSDHASNAHPSNAATLEPISMELDPSITINDDSDNPHSSLPSHASFLHDSFRNRIGLEPTKRTEVDITNFDGVIVAKGYNRILPTWQGYYIELEKHDVVWASLRAKNSPSYGEECWVSQGLSVFSRIRPDTRRTPRPHRFALKTPTNYNQPCNPLQPHKWYIHAYQARFLVDDYSRSLNSRTIASNLKEMFPDAYLPRDKDLMNISHLNEPKEAQQKTTFQMPQPQLAHTIPATVPISYPPFAPTTFQPMPNLPAPYLPPGITIPTEYSPPTPLLKQPSAQRNSVPNLLAPNHATHQPRPITFNQQQTPQPSYAQVANPHYFHKIPQPIQPFPHANLWYNYPSTIPLAGQQVHPRKHHHQPAPQST